VRAEHYQYVIIAQYVGLSIWHGGSRNWLSALYWISAAGITTAATLGMGGK
jgi:hypothetical protein